MAIIIPGVPRVDPKLKVDSILWRYLDAAKFFHLIHTQQLYFTRGDQLEDKFEGAFTKSLSTAIKQSYDVNKIEFTYEEFKKRLRERVFLNCWRNSPDDSMAMWEIYGRSATSLAVTTTVAKLRDAINDSKTQYKVAIKKVKYVKYWRDPRLRISPYSDVFAYKVKAYDFEKEVRVIIDRFHEEFETPISDVGMSIPVKINKLLRSVVVGPEAPSWFFSLVKDVTSKSGVRTDIRRSMLANDPI